MFSEGKEIIHPALTVGGTIMQKTAQEGGVCGKEIANSDTGGV